LKKYSDRSDFCTIGTLVICAIHSTKVILQGKRRLRINFTIVEPNSHKQLLAGINISRSHKPFRLQRKENCNAEQDHAGTRTGDCHYNPADTHWNFVCSKLTARLHNQLLRQRSVLSITRLVRKLTKPGDLPAWQQGHENG
jgi:hypothetical protein